jgi:hypothetical protein
MKTLDAELAKEAKAIVTLAFRNGPIEDVHAGKVCPVCNGSSEYSRITEETHLEFPKTRFLRRRLRWPARAPS